MARVTYSGDPGETFTNTTGRVLYQFFCNWSNTCGLCSQYDSLIGPSWPIPMHRGCRCVQKAIWPGKTSHPFTDFRARIDSLAPDQQAKVVGVANLQLIDAGVVKWEDVVTGQRVRDLREVVATKKLSVATMTGAGVTRSVAERAYETVHTPAHELADQQRQELLQKVLDKGVTKEQLKQALGERLAARVGIAGPGGAATMPVTPTTPKVPRKKTAARVTVAARADYLEKAGVKPEVAEAIAKQEATAEVVRFAEQVHEAIAAIPETHLFGGDKAFIHHVYGTYKAAVEGAAEMPYDEFQRLLIEAHRLGKVELSRADMVEAMSRINVRLSSTKYMGATFNFVRARR